MSHFAAIETQDITVELESVALTPKLTCAQWLARDLRSKARDRQPGDTFSDWLVMASGIHLVNEARFLSSSPGQQLLLALKGSPTIVLELRSSVFVRSALNFLVETRQIVRHCVATLSK